MLLISATAVAQEEVTPKVDIFVGYQWLNPGDHFPPAPFQPPNAAFGLTMGIFLKGRRRGTYNFTPHLGLEADYGLN